MDEYYGKFGAHPAVTSLHPAVLIIILAVCAYMFVTTKKRIAALFLVLSIIIPMDQRLAVAGYNVFSIRILIFCSWLPLLLTSRFKLAAITSLDKIFIVWAVAKVVVWIVLWQNIPASTNIIGWMLTAFGIYFLFRVLITNTEDIDSLLRVLAVVSIVIAISMLVEQITGRNLFAYLGSSSSLTEFTQIRGGKLRSQGPFQHPICAGMFGATLVPLFIMQIKAWKKSKNYGIIGLIAALVIVITSSSSGPMLSMLMGIVGLLCWVFRCQMRVLRWSALFVIIALHLVMKAPVWAIIAKVTVVGGSTGYHRVELIDRFVTYFHEWWLLGTKDTGHWGYGMDDMINFFIVQGVQGGLLGFILFIVLIIRCYKIIGRKLRETGDLSEQFIFWGLGATLFTHIVGFFGIAYFDQQVVMMYLLFAFISMLACTNLKIAKNRSHILNNPRNINSIKVRRVDLQILSGVLF
jgi:hypothetical protein